MPISLLPYPHPALSSVPVVLFTAAAAFELVAQCFNAPRFASASRLCFFAGALILPLTYLSGLSAHDQALEQMGVAVLGAANGVMEPHERLARLSLFLLALPGISLVAEYFVDSSLRSKRLCSRFYLLSILGLSLLLLNVATKGGELVFRYGVGVERDKAPKSVHEAAQ